MQSLLGVRCHLQPKRIKGGTGWVRPKLICSSVDQPILQCIALESPLHMVSQVGVWLLACRRLCVAYHAEQAMQAFNFGDCARNAELATFAIGGCSVRKWIQ